MSSSIAKSLERSNDKTTIDNPCTSCNKGCTCGKDCNCGSDCTCNVCSGHQAKLAGDDGNVANPPGAGETRGRDPPSQAVAS